MPPQRVTLPRKSVSSKPPSTITSPPRKNCSIWSYARPIVRLYDQVEEIVRACLPSRTKIERAIHAHLAAFDENYPHMFVYVQELPNLIHTLLEDSRI